MKILLLKKDILDLDTLNAGIALAKEKALTIGLTLDFTLKDTTKMFSSVPIENGRIAVNSTEIFQEGLAKGYVFEEDAIVCLVYDWTKVIPQPTNPAMLGLSMQMPQQFYVTYPEVFMEFFLHELSHYFRAKTGKADLTHNYDLAFSTKPRFEWYLHLIKECLPPISRWKYFKPTEKTGSQGTIADLEPILVDLLDKARDIAGIPFSITSGKRSVAQNEDVGGVTDSSHIKGLAVDIRARDSREHYLITKGLVLAGFKRISRKYPTHIHVDIDPDKPQEVLF